MMNWNELYHVIDAAGETGMHAVALSALNAVVYTFSVMHMSTTNDAERLAAECIAGADGCMASQVAFAYVEGYLDAHGIKWAGITIEHIHKYSHGKDPESWHVCFKAVVYVKEAE